MYIVCVSHEFTCVSKWDDEESAIHNARMLSELCNYVSVSVWKGEYPKTREFVCKYSRGAHVP